MMKAPNYKVFSIYIFVVMLVFPGLSNADMIFLKSGEAVEGKIVHETPIFVRVQTGDRQAKEYLHALIERIDRDSPVEEQAEEAPAEAVSPEGPAASQSTIILKTGRVIKGTIFERTPAFIRVQTDDAVGVQDFRIELIDKILSGSEEAFAPTTAGRAERDRQDPATKTSEAPESPERKTGPEPAKIVPEQILISKNTPEPNHSFDYDYRRDYDRESSPDGVLVQNVPKTRTYNFGSAPPAPTVHSGLQGSSQGGLAQTAQNTPNIFNTEAFNQFFDQNVLSSETAGGEQRSRQRMAARALAAQAKAASGKGARGMEKIKEVLPFFILAITAGIGIPVVAILLIFVVCLLKMPLEKSKNKEIHDELASFETLKAEGKISEAEYMNLTKEARSRLSEHPLKAFLRSVPAVFLYPLRGQVLLAALAGAVGFYVFRFAALAPFYGMIIVIFGFCYLVACIVKIIETAVREGRQDIFEWPGYTEIVDWFGEAFLFLLGWIICHGTAILAFGYLIQYESFRVFTVGLSVGLFIIGVFVYPMYILSISLVGGFASLNIVNIFKAIGTTFVPYTMTFLLLSFTEALSGLAHAIPLNRLPLFGGLLQWFITVYFLLVDMRLLGIFYKTHRMKLRWYGEDDP